MYWSFSDITVQADIWNSPNDQTMHATTSVMSRYRPLRVEYEIDAGRDICDWALMAGVPRAPAGPPLPLHIHHKTQTIWPWLMSSRRWEDRCCWSHPTSSGSLLETNKERLSNWIVAGNIDDSLPHLVVHPICLACLVRIFFLGGAAVKAIFQ